MKRRVVCGLLVCSILLCSACSSYNKTVKKDDEDTSTGVLETIFTSVVGSMLSASNAFSDINTLSDFDEELTIPGLKTSKLTESQKTCVLLADGYLSSSAFSRIALSKLLSSDGISDEDIEIAFDYMQIDWEVQAVKKIKILMQFDKYDIDMLRNKLRSALFTEEEINNAFEFLGIVA